jgi:type IV pilus assembly protein PilE
MRRARESGRQRRRWALPATGMHTTRSNGSAGGFTIIELLVALAILAAISAIAFPLYTAYSVRSYRAEAQADLLGCAQGVERFASERFSYVGAADTDGDGEGDDDEGPVAGEICNPRAAQDNRYEFAIESSATGFLLTATPIAAAGNPVRDDGFMTIDDAGNRGWDRDASGTISNEEQTWEP